jgi:acyl-CoA dehydrogenase
LGSKGIIGGPKNLLGVSYRHAPIAITVEGANLLTRALIIFGQGAIRCHPHVLNEMAAVQAQDTEKLGKALFAHAGHGLSNLWRSLVHAPLLLHGTRHLAPLRDLDLIAFADTLRDNPALVDKLCPDLLRPKNGGLLDLMQALEAAQAVGDELPALNQALRRTHSLEAVARQARNPAAALAYLRAADRVIQVDDFDDAPAGLQHEPSGPSSLRSFAEN